jgi:hypothetical protein
VANTDTIYIFTYKVITTSQWEQLDLQD